MCKFEKKILQFEYFQSQKLVKNKKKVGMRVWEDKGTKASNLRVFLEEVAFLYKSVEPQKDRRKRVGENFQKRSRGAAAAAAVENGQKKSTSPTKPPVWDKT